MVGLDRSQRSLRARIAAHAMHAVHDGRATTAAARQALRDRFLREANELFPELPEAERLKRAEHLRRAFYAKLAFESSKQRSKTATNTKVAGLESDDSRNDLETTDAASIRVPLAV